MPSFCYRLLALLALGLSCWTPSPALAGDLEDCNGPVIEKIEPACTAVINDSARSADERSKAYVTRSRLLAGRAKFDAAAADAEAALQLNPQSVPALLARGYARQRTGNFDAGLADLNRALEREPKNPFVFAARAA